MTASTAPSQTIFFPLCTPYPFGNGNTEGSNGGAATPTGQCSFVFQPQPGVSYTINSKHFIWFNQVPFSLSTNCGDMFDYHLCWSDPEGFWIFPWGNQQEYSSTNASISEEVTASKTGTGVSQYVPWTYWYSQGVGTTQVRQYEVARASAVYTPVTATITDTSDIMNGNITVKLTAPSGTTGDLTLDFNGSSASGTELSQAPFTALAPGSQELQLPFDSILPGIYPMANGTRDATLPGTSTAQAVTVPDYTLPTPWTYFRKIFYTQYNIPHESACSGNDVDAWLVSKDIVRGKTTCSFKRIKLNSQFIKATWRNGTGVSEHYGTLKNAAAVKLGDAQNCVGQYPPGAIGHSKAGGNTFEVVASVTGACPNQTLVKGQSLAMPCTQIGKQCPVSILSGVQVLSCGDQLNLDSGNYATAFTRTVDDKCPACSDTSPFSDENSPMYGADGHIDAFSSNTSCTGKGVGNLGSFYTSYPTN